MTAAHADGIIRRYLSRLGRELAGFPSAYRDEVLDEIREHITEARPDGETDADILRILHRLGDPRTIAADARERFDLPPVRATLTDLVALVLLALSLSVVGYVAGLVLVWRSVAWTTTNKVVATVLPPVSLGLALLSSRWHLLSLAVAAILIAAATPVYLAIRLRHKSRWLTGAVAAVAFVGAVPVVVISLLLAATVNGLSQGVGYGYSIVNGQHVCQEGKNNAPMTTVPCSSIPGPLGGWSSMTNPLDGDGYQYAITGGRDVCSTDNRGTLSTVPCDVVPAPTGGWSAVKTGGSAGCGPAPCRFVPATPSSTFTCTAVANAQTCIATVPTFAPSPESTDGR